PFARAALGVGVILEAPKCILQDSHHQLLDRADRAVVAPAVVELLRRQNVRHEEISESAIFPFHCLVLTLLCLHPTSGVRRPTTGILIFGRSSDDIAMIMPNSVATATNAISLAC